MENMERTSYDEAEELLEFHILKRLGSPVHGSTIQRYEWATSRVAVKCIGTNTPVGLERVPSVRSLQTTSSSVLLDVETEEGALTEDEW